jgi:hypothetical protein
MMIKGNIYEVGSGEQIKIQKGFSGKQNIVTEGSRLLDAQWNSVLNIGATTVIVASPKNNESLLITDIIVTSPKKVNNSSAIIRFFDGTNSVILFNLEGSDSAIQFNHSFEGGVRGWKDAMIEIITDTALQAVTTMLTYVRIGPEFTQNFDVWSNGG